MKSITEDILDWSKNYIEKPNETLGNVPVCPYAKKARETKALKILEVTDHTKLIDSIVEGTELIKDPATDIVIVGCSDIEITVDELNATIHAYNVVFVPQDIYLMASHPYDDEEDEPVEFLDTDGWEPDNEFLMVLIQNFDKLEKASDIMHKKRYYSAWPRDYYEGTVLKRQSYRSYRDDIKKSR
tara:strand:+ start:120 stop:674 length:555 start_codon:yes stop_codon:yes gene_type:complete